MPLHVAFPVFFVTAVTLGRCQVRVVAAASHVGGASEWRTNEHKSLRSFSPTVSGARGSLILLGFYRGDTVPPVPPIGGGTGEQGCSSSSEHAWNTVGTDEHTPPFGVIKKY